MRPRTRGAGWRKGGNIKTIISSLKCHYTQKNLELPGENSVLFRKQRSYATLSGIPLIGPLISRELWGYLPRGSFRFFRVKNRPGLLNWTGTGP